MDPETAEAVRQHQVDLDRNEIAQYRTAIRAELVQLWGDLHQATQDAMVGGWSVGCENLADRIVELTQLVGPVGWEQIDTALVFSGVYEKVHRDAGLEPRPIDWPAVQRFAERRGSAETSPGRDWYVECPSEYVGTSPAVFLAGGISGCPDWQHTAATLLHQQNPDLVVLNPRRFEFPMDDPDAAADQISWEYRHLQRAEVTLFWFPASGPVPQPIALYELGAAVTSDRAIAVGADPQYIRRADVVEQLRHARSWLPVHSDLLDTCRAALVTVKEVVHFPGRPTAAG